MLRAGDVLSDRFEVEGLAASGGMGAVFRARDRTTNERVAVKVLRASIWDEVQEHEGRSTEVEVPAGFVSNQCKTSYGDPGRVP